MADKKDYPNRRVLSLEEVEAVAGGAVARHSMSLITVESYKICGRCGGVITYNNKSMHDSGLCVKNTGNKGNSVDKNK